jgi:AmmeMemoRadiSam system protein B
VVLLSFSHRGIGPAFGLWSGGPWRTPLGEIPIAVDVAARIRATFPHLEDDETGFLGEHSGEVQVPFLQELRPDCRIAPFSLNAWVGGRSGEAELDAFGAALAGVVKDELVLATTDLTHCGEAYGAEPPPGVTPRDFTRGQDRAILRTIQALSLPDFFETRQRMGVSMCGVSPTAAFIAFGRAAGAATADLVSYATSADDEPDADRAVGYPGAVIWS